MNSIAQKLIKWMRPRKKETESLKFKSISLLDLLGSDSTSFRTPSLSNLYSEVTGYVYRCVRIIADTAASCELHLKDEFGREVDTEPLRASLSSPNWEMTFYDFIYLVVSQMKIFGNSYWLYIREGDQRTRGLWPLDPREVKPIINDAAKTPADIVKGYDYKGREYSSDDILVFKNLNIVDPLREGTSELIRIWEYLKQNKLLQIARTSSLESGGIPPYFLVITDATAADPDIIARLKKEAKLMSGGVKHIAEPAVYPLGVDVKPLGGITPRELEFSDAYRLIREDIASLLGVPKTKLGLMEDSNRASSIVATQTFIENTILPILGNIERKLTSDWIWMFDPSLSGKFKFEFDPPKIVDEELELRKWQIAIENMLVSREEARRALLELDTKASISAEEAIGASLLSKNNQISLKEAIDYIREKGIPEEVKAKIQDFLAR